MKRCFPNAVPSPFTSERQDIYEIYNRIAAEAAATKATAASLVVKQAAAKATGATPKAKAVAGAAARVTAEARAVRGVGARAFRAAGSVVAKRKAASGQSGDDGDEVGAAVEPA